MATVKGLAARVMALKFKKVIERKGHTFFESGDYNLNIIGVRNSSGDASKFDDFLNMFYKVRGNWIWDCFQITTEPGWKILKRPINEKGTAILVPDQYRGAYKIDIHKTYPALCQRGGTVKVWRDNNRDSEPDYVGPEDEGWYGINIHKHSGPDTRTDTGGSSAGCQVFKSARDFDRFMKICNLSKDRWGNKFTYTLIEEKDLNFC